MMYTASSPKELKKLLEEDKFPIQITDEKTKKVVEILESLKSKGVLSTAKDEIKKEVIRFIASTTTVNALSEAAIVAIVAISLSTIVALYALYKNKNITWTVKPDGSFTLNTN